MSIHSRQVVEVLQSCKSTFIFMRKQTLPEIRLGQTEACSVQSLCAVFWLLPWQSQEGIHTPPQGRLNGKGCRLWGRLGFSHRAPAPLQAAQLLQTPRPLSSSGSERQSGRGLGGGRSTAHSRLTTAASPFFPSRGSYSEGHPDGSWASHLFPAPSGAISGQLWRAPHSSPFNSL